MAIWYIYPPQNTNHLKAMDESGRDELVRRIKELNEEEARRMCTHVEVEVVSDAYNRRLYEVCRACGQRIY